MQVYGPAYLHGPQSINAPHGARISPPADRTASPIRDELHISDAARLAEESQNVSDARQARIGDIRAQIAAGTYETPDKLDAAMNRLLDEIG